MSRIRQNCLKLEGLCKNATLYKSRNHLSQVNVASPVEVRILEGRSDVSSMAEKRPNESDAGS
ncbi:hypothetical protein ABEB36_005516 [Hypothenemus hampei]|uniref:Uncharacterized protein n=1 Tax=Hypothenemus hampei TaxID=57062 RepID=A0ABD1EZ28_HYPHA